MPRRVRHSASAAERAFVGERPATAGATPLASLGGGSMPRAASAHALQLRRAPSSATLLSSAHEQGDGGGDENASQQQQQPSVLRSEASMRQGYTGEDGCVVHPTGWKDGLSGRRVTTPTVDKSLSRIGSIGGRLSSEEYGRWTGMRPGVRELYFPGVMKPLCQPSEAEMMAKSRPKPTTTIVKTSKDQVWTLGAGMRSSDLIGLGARPRTASSLTRAKSTAELNYLAQFEHNDSGGGAVFESGLKRRSTSSDVLEAVEWRKQQIERAGQLDSWAVRLSEPSSSSSGGPMMPSHHEAYRVAERQRLRDLQPKRALTQHASGGLMQKEVRVAR